MTLWAMRLANVRTSESVWAAQDVFLEGAWVEVVVVATRSVTAKMVQRETLRDRPHELLVHHTVSWSNFAFDPELAVATSIHATKPRPAATFFGGVDEIEKPNAIVNVHRVAPIFAGWHRG